MKKNMNKAIISLLICTFTLLASCDLLDVEPKTQWSSSNVPTELAHLQGLVYGGYNRLGSVLQQGFVTYGDTRADVYYVSSGTQTTWDKIVRNRLDVNMSQANWRSFFEVIKQANVVIHYTPELISNTKVTAAQANTLLGQAYCQRAFAYLWIIRIWGDAPIVTRALLNSEDSFDVRRSPASEVLGQMHHDLDSALKYIPAQTTAAAITRITFSPVAARAIKAHAYMWEHRYEEALEQLNLAIPTTSTLYRLAALYDPAQTPAESSVFRTWVATTEFSRMFNTSGTSGIPESIFELSFSEEDGDVNNIFENMWTGGNRYFSAREDFRDIFQTDDSRTYASFGSRSGNRIDVLKWVMGYARGDSRNIPLIRLADLKLLRAEARAMLVPEDPTDDERDAIMSDVNDIIQRARGPLGIFPASAYKDRGEDGWFRQDFINTVKRERRRELAFEGQRWFDLVRWGDAVDALAAMTKTASTSYYWETGPIVLDPRSIPWPIHFDEIRRSKYIEQNEFYR